MGCYCFRLADVSVDGLHRILHNLPGQLRIFCMSQTAKAPNSESKQVQRDVILENIYRRACSVADPFWVPLAVQGMSWTASRILSKVEV